MSRLVTSEPFKGEVNFTPLGPREAIVERVTFLWPHRYLLPAREWLRFYLRHRKALISTTATSDRLPTLPSVVPVLPEAKGDERA